MELHGGTTHTSKDGDLYSIKVKPGVGELCWVLVLVAPGSVHYLLWQLRTVEICTVETIPGSWAADVCTPLAGMGFFSLKGTVWKCLSKFSWFLQKLEDPHPVPLAVGEGKKKNNSLKYSLSLEKPYVPQCPLQSYGPWCVSELRKVQSSVGDPRGLETRLGKPQPFTSMSCSIQTHLTPCDALVQTPTTWLPYRSQSYTKK